MKQREGNGNSLCGGVLGRNREADILTEYITFHIFCLIFFFTGTTWVEITVSTMNSTGIIMLHGKTMGAIMNRMLHLTGITMAAWKGEWETQKNLQKKILNQLVSTYMT